MFSASTLWLLELDRPPFRQANSVNGAIPISRECIPLHSIATLADCVSGDQPSRVRLAFLHNVRILQRLLLSTRVKENCSHSEGFAFALLCRVKTGIARDWLCDGSIETRVNFWSYKSRHYPHKVLSTDRSRRLANANK